MGSNALKALVETPGMPGEAPDIEEVELPPEEMWAQLDNSGQAPAKDAPAAAEAGAQAAAAAWAWPDAAPGEVAEIQFLSDRDKVVPLKFPFTWEGREYSQIRIRPLTLGDVSKLQQRPAGVKVTLFDLYSRMTGLPSSVLRALESGDGEAVTNLAYDFLPPSLRTDGG